MQLTVKTSALTGFFILVILVMIKLKIGTLVSISLIVQSDIVDGDGCRSTDNYLNRRFYLLQNNTSSYGVYENGGEETDAKESSNQISHPGRTQRLVQEYDMEDFVWCLDSLSLKRKRRPIHIAFIGDSTVRQHFISFQRVNLLCFVLWCSLLITRFYRFVTVGSRLR